MLGSENASTLAVLLLTAIKKGRSGGSVGNIGIRRFGGRVDFVKERDHRGWTSITR